MGPQRLEPRPLPWHMGPREPLFMRLVELQERMRHCMKTDGEKPR